MPMVHCLQKKLTKCLGFGLSKSAWAWDFKPKVSKLYQGLKLKSQNFQKLKKIEKVQSVLNHLLPAKKISTAVQMFLTQLQPSKGKAILHKLQNQRQYLRSFPHRTPSSLSCPLLPLPSPSLKMLNMFVPPQNPLEPRFRIWVLAQNSLESWFQIRILAQNSLESWF